MADHSSAPVARLEAALPSERERLVRLCTWLTGDADVAEDLAQEILIEAWHNAHKLTDPRGQTQWLNAIARNVSLRWARARGRDLARRAELPARDSSIAPTTADGLVDGMDLELELERAELAGLLDRALALLPPATRSVLVERYVHEAPVADVAARLRLTEGAVTMRLQRGKRLLRQVLATDLQDEAAAYGLLAEHGDGWQVTRLWCPLCGDRQLLGRFEPDTRALHLRCATCTPGPHMNVGYGGDAEMFEGVHGYRAALKRLLLWSRPYFEQGLATGVARCLKCGHSAAVRVGRAEDAPVPSIKHGVATLCPACDEASFSALCGLALSRPESLRFWRDHPRLYALPARDCEVAGRPALVASFQSVRQAARLDVVVLAETFEVLQIHGAPRD